LSTYGEKKTRKLLNFKPFNYHYHLNTLPMNTKNHNYKPCPPPDVRQMWLFGLDSKERKQLYDRLTHCQRHKPVACAPRADFTNLWLPWPEVPRDRSDMGKYRKCYERSSYRFKNGRKFRPFPISENTDIMVIDEPPPPEALLGSYSV